MNTMKGGTRFSEGTVIGVGMTVLLVLVAIAVALFLIYGRKAEQYEFLEKEPIELAFGVRELVEQEKQGYESVHSWKLVLGVVLCILSVVPIMLLAVPGESDMMAIMGVEICLSLVAVAVFLLVSTGMVYGSFQKLLEEGDYTRQQKLKSRKTDAVDTVYWCLAIAIYLGWSFWSMEWDKTWIIWPIAGVLYSAVSGIKALFRKL